MDFGEAVSSHQRWKVLLASMVQGNSKERLDPALLSREDQCDLGKWILGAGAKECGTRPEFAALKDAHARFHRAAGEVARKAQGGDQAGAQQLLDGDFFALSSHVILAITRLRKACGK
ncbi:MAG: CZB domain-containing protein [Acidobacteria bacterium]|nr:CZB domain-containing protein [Acidobacteriota bacterium]